MLSGKVATIVGGGGGIGAACARALADAGAKVAIIDRSPEAAAAAATRIGGMAISADVASETSLTEALDSIEGALGGVDILINAAAIFQAPIPAARLSLEKWDDIVRVSQRGTFLTCQILGQRMAARGGGAIVNIASVAAMQSLPLYAYGPAKAAVVALSASLAVEWGRSGVRVNALSPGFTLTPAVRAAIESGAADMSAVAASSALNRLVAPDEVAQAVLFLVSPAASAITGINLPVDCGWLAGIGWTAYGGLDAFARAKRAGP